MKPDLKFPAILIVFLLLFIVTGWTQIAIGTTNPDPSAEFEIQSNNKGFLPPRIALTATNIAAPVNEPAIGLLIYNTATSGGTPNNVSPGYYYWNGTSWYPLVNKGYTPGDMQYWNGSRWITIPLGLNNQVLTICGGIPQWGPCPQSFITLNPSNNPYEGYIDPYYPNNWFNSNTEIIMGAWTSNGLPENYRTCLKFDYSSIPSGITIDSAILYLFATQTPLGGNTIDAHYGSSNACYIQRITASWVLPNPFTWNSQPSFTPANQAVIPQSTTAFQNDTIDVTQMVRDMLPGGNNGFLLKLQNEVTYNIRQYGSSYNTNAALRPKLKVYYH